MIPAEHKTEIVQSGMNFMRSITTAYGVDEGMKLWETIVSTLDPDIKGSIFFAMLTGEYNDRITLSSAVNSANKVWMIKSIRAVTGLGLKEAKELADDVLSGKTVTIKCDPKNRSQALFELRNAGFHV